MINAKAFLLLALLFIVSCSKTTASSKKIIFEDSSTTLTQIITTLGTISTVAGSKGFGSNPTGFGIAATAAKLNYTRGVIIDGDGNLFISTESHRILKVTASTGIITSVAGTGTFGFSGDGAAATFAKLYYPRGMAFDKAGNIFVADQFNNRIRKINVSTGIITTVAGGGTASTAVDDVQATSTILNSPRDVAVDTAGNIYIADTNNYRVRKVTASTGIITAFAGNGKVLESAVLGVTATDTTLCYPRGITLDSSGNAFIADFGYNSIYKVTANTGKISLLAGANKFVGGYNGDDILATTATLLGPRDIVIDTPGNIFFSDGGNYRVRKITASSGMINTVAGGGPDVSKLCQTYEYDGDGKDATLASLCLPDGVALDSSGSLFICDSGHRVVRKVTFTEVSPSTVLTRAPSVTPVTGAPTTATPSSTASPTVSTPSAPSATTPSSPTVSSPSSSSAPAMTPSSSSNGSPAPATPSASMSSAPATQSSAGSQSSSTRHITGVHHVTKILLSSLLLFTLTLYRDA